MILVTGGTGLVGSHLLLQLLKEEQSVKALCRKTSRFDDVKAIFQHYNQAHLFELIEWIEADLIAYHDLVDALEGVEVVYHCAAMVSFSPKDRMEIFFNKIREMG